MTKRIIIDFSGWCVADLDKCNFQYTGTDETVKSVITGREYLNLTKEQKRDYILENVIDAINSCEDSEWDYIHVEENDDEVM